MTAQQSIDSAEYLYRKLVRTFDRRATYGDHQIDWALAHVHLRVLVLPRCARVRQPTGGAAGQS
jgi:hypothetical protein